MKINVNEESAPFAALAIFAVIVSAVAVGTFWGCVDNMAQLAVAKAKLQHYEAGE